MKGSRSAVGTLAVACVVLILVDTSWVGCACFLVCPWCYSNTLFQVLLLETSQSIYLCSSEMSLCFNLLVF